jgi:hypothetical protein
LIDRSIDRFASIIKPKDARLGNAVRRAFLLRFGGLSQGKKNGRRLLLVFALLGAA